MFPSVSFLSRFTTAGWRPASPNIEALNSSMPSLVSRSNLITCDSGNSAGKSQLFIIPIAPNNQEWQLLCHHQ